MGTSFTLKMPSSIAYVDDLDESFMAPERVERLFEPEELDLSQAPAHVRERRQTKEVTGDFVREYATKYIQEMQNRSGLFWLHVSKTAGSTVCTCGKRMGCHAPWENCHDRDDSFLWEAKRRNPAADCAGMAERMQKQ